MDKQFASFPEKKTVCPLAEVAMESKCGSCSFTEKEAEEMREMFASGFFPPEEQEAIRDSVRKRESTANEVLWATRLKYMARVKAQAAATRESVSAEAERDGGKPDIF